MRAHVSLNVADVNRSVEFYQRVFGAEPQKRTASYAKFDLPELNFTLQSGGGREPSRVNHLGIEVRTAEEVRAWGKRLVEAGLVTVPEEGTDCCYARQDKVWIEDPDGNAWEIFVVHEQLPVPQGEETASNPCGSKKPGAKCC